MKWTIGQASLHGTHNANIIWDENGDGVAQVYDLPMHTKLEDVDKKRFAKGLKVAALIAAAPQQAARIAALEAREQELIAALKEITLLAPERMLNVYEMQKIARAVLAKVTK